jgi:hypothetical protein
MHSTFNEEDIKRMIAFQQEILENHGITFEHLLWFINLSRDERDAYVAGRRADKRIIINSRFRVSTMGAPQEQSEKFALLADLGIITVPQDHVHTADFVMIHGDEYMNYHSHESIVTGAFLNPDRILKAGDKLRVRVFQKVSNSFAVTQKDICELFTKEKAVYTGLQGALLVLKLKRKQLPVGFSCVSFERQINLWFSDTVPPVPYVEAISAEEYLTNVLNFHYLCIRSGVAFLVFTEVPSEERGEISKSEFPTEEP